MTTPFAEAHILVVEDTQMMRVLMVRNLQQAGFKNVADAADGQQALDWLKTNKTDVILLDIQMPVLDGYGALEAIKADRELKEAIVIMVTAVDKIESVAKCLEMGADDYMPKLFNPLLLASRLNLCLELRELRGKVQQLKA